MAFKVRALIVSMGGLQLQDVSLKRTSANVMQLGTGDTLRIATGTGVSGTEARIVIPHATALAGTAFIASNGEIMIGRTHASTINFLCRLNGTTYQTVLTAV